MKKNLLVAALMTAGVLSASAFAADGKINFVGAITDDACTVVNDMSNPLTVTLGTVISSIPCCIRQPIWRALTVLPLTLSSKRLCNRFYSAME
ncbi:fimbrial protein [Serratia fonticola]|uniref:fimbrial protein n=1 Tax=Serratia fonticola TaxID=47917 RepID=UPI003AF400A1